MEFIAGLLLIVLALWVVIQLFPKKRKKRVAQEIIITPEFQQALDIIEKSNDSLFITGKAGTGKSSLLRYFLNNTKKKNVVLAPTGIAALNVNGQTIHSFFKLPPRIIDIKNISPDYVRADLFEKIETIIIDEVSMVRVDLMDAIDNALRKNRNRLLEPFGGVQMVFIGDLFQLPPVMRMEDRNTIITKYAGHYFFDAPVFKSFKYHFLELTRIFRQDETQEKFKQLLNNIRENKATFDDLKRINSRHISNVGGLPNSIILTTKRDIAHRINHEKLELINKPPFIFLGELTGKFSGLKNLKEEEIENKLPAPNKLILKEGAQVMMLKNDSGKRWVNGSIGHISKLESDKVKVDIDGVIHLVEKETWKEVEFVLNKDTNQIEEKVLGSFNQYPIQLAYAMTIHKSQGKTFEKITIDIGNGAFAHGQIYVAVSRCKTLEGIVLNNPIKDKDIIVDPRIVKYYDLKSPPDRLDKNDDDSSTTIISQIKRAIDNNYSIKIQYCNYDGESSNRILSKIRYTNKFDTYGFQNQHIEAFCHLRNEDRRFKISRIVKLEFLKK